MRKKPAENILESIIEEEFTTAFDSRFTRYALMSLEDRALPDARDGLKPSQRRVLVAMNDLKLNPGGKTTKSAKICGITSGDYHPHGEAIVYPTMYRLAQSWVMREPLVLGQGNFGSVDGDEPASMRYTEAKLSPVGESMLDDLSPDVVEFVSNYNEEKKEPTVLPGKFPNLLVNGTEGIAVGWATKFPPHNLKEIAKVIEAYINNRNITTKDVIKLMPGPDFPTGGKLLGQSEVLEYYNTGHGNLQLEGKWEISKSNKGVESIIIRELPYQVSPSKLGKQIEDLCKNETIQGISDMKNLSSDRTEIIIECKNGNVNVVLNNLLKYTDLRTSFNVNCTVLINGKVVPDAGILKLIAAFVSHRTVVLTAKYTAERKALLSRIHILDGLISVSKKITEAIELIRSSKDDAEAAAKLIAAKLVTSNEQANAVLNITLRQLTRLEGTKLLDEQKKKQERVVWLNKILSDPSEIDRLIIAEQLDLAEAFGSERKTQISKTEAQDINIEQLTPDEDILIALSGDGYIKSLSAKENIQEFKLLSTNSKNNVMFFTNKGLAYRRYGHQIPKGSKNSKGVHVSSFLDLSEGEFVVDFYDITDIGDKKYFVFFTKGGLIKRSNMAEYETSLKNAGLAAIKLNNDQVKSVQFTTGKQDLFIVTASGLCVKYNESIVLEQGRNTQGSRALKLNTGDEVASAIALRSKDTNILVITENGYAKKSLLTEYKNLESRQVKGYQVMNKTPKTGAVIGAVGLPETGYMSVQTGKQLVIVDSKEISDTGRTTSGNRIKMQDNDKVIKAARLDISPAN